MVRAERSGGVLVVSMLSSFLNSWLTMRLPDLFATHPEIDLRMQCTPALADFSRSDVHVAIRIGRGNWPRLHVEKLFDDYLVPLCSPKTLARHGSLPGPGTTANYPLLYSSSEPWEMWTEGRAFDTESWPERGSAFDDSVAILTAAVHGEGLVLSRWSLAQPFLASGQLVRASSSVIAYGQSWYFVCPTAYLELRKVQGFRQWLLDQAAAMPQP
jgi:LysR family glycine cleavage system transcriptional activator